MRGRTLAQAKVNLALRILGRNADGYHSIETVFLRIDLSDSVTVRVTGGKRSLRCDEAAGPAEENLGFRAAALFARETGWPKGFEIEIEKRIPVGAGLGGGSADAAAVLRIMNALSPDPLMQTRLLDVARELGSDLPFLASDYVMALASGRGEILTSLPPLPSRDIILYVPPRAMATADAYSAVARQRGHYPPRPPAFSATMFDSWENTAFNSVNDFEPIVVREIAEVATWLASGARFGKFTRMTGSGSTVFEVTGVTTRPVAPSELSLPFMPIPAGSITINTRSARNVVPVEILD